MSRVDRAGSYHKVQHDAESYKLYYVPSDTRADMLPVCKVTGCEEQAQFVVDLLNDADEHGGRGAELARLLASLTVQPDGEIA